jgi:hypothetical protein
MTRLLARHIREHAVAKGHPRMARIAQGTVCKILASQEVKPHKVRYYLERRDEAFETKMADVLWMALLIIVLATVAAIAGKVSTEAELVYLTHHIAVSDTFAEYPRGVGIPLGLLAAMLCGLLMPLDRLVRHLNIVTHSRPIPAPLGGMPRRRRKKSLLAATVNLEWGKPPPRFEQKLSTRRRQSRLLRFRCRLLRQTALAHRAANAT